MDARAERVASNENAFRSVNERLAELADADDASVEVVCECDRLECVQRLAVPRGEYERIRAHGQRFIVATGHERLEFERVVDARGAWLIVEKTGAVGEIAAGDDPRNR